jgi:hypothetical protein
MLSVVCPLLLLLLLHVMGKLGVHSNNPTHSTSAS